MLDKEWWTGWKVSNKVVGIVFPDTKTAVVDMKMVSPEYTSDVAENGPNGFTLVELMVVVAIVATLAAIGMPSYLRYLNKVRINDVIIDIRMLERDIALYKELNGELPSNLESLGTGDHLDRWGNPYHYLRVIDAHIGQLRKDRNLVPVNTDYDLYSMGADGESRGPFTAKASLDDIIRANDGEFVGLVSDY